MLKLNGYTVDFKSFPNKETYADIPRTGTYAPLHFGKKEYNVIDFKFEGDSDIFNLVRLKGFVDDIAPMNVPCILNMPYIPYSRMDRAEEERLFSLRYFAQLVNSLNFSRINVMEPHSDVSMALFNRVFAENMSMTLALMAMRDTLGLEGSAWVTDHASGPSTNNYAYTIEGLWRRAEEAGIYLLFPDAGAEKRYSKQTQYPNIITCSKKRDFNTGKITSIRVNNLEDAEDCKVAIIVDDLCARGTSFSGAAKELRYNIAGIESVILCVTHCEDTIYDGDLITGSDIQKIYTTDSILARNPVTEQEKNKIKILTIF